MIRLDSFRSLQGFWQWFGFSKAYADVAVCNLAIAGATLHCLSADTMFKAAAALRFHIMPPRTPWSIYGASAPCEDRGVRQAAIGA